VKPDIDVVGDTIYLEGRPIAVFMPALSAPERRSAEEALGLRLPPGGLR
jgi:hypothetical protein